MKFRELTQKPAFWLTVIFVIVLAVRLYITFQTSLFNYDAYFSLRQVDNIRSTGFPLYKDPLSYGGKTQLFAPLNYYLLTIFSFVMPTDIMGKVLPNIIAALLVILAYYLALKITKNTKSDTKNLQKILNLSPVNQATKKADPKTVKILTLC